MRVELRYDNMIVPVDNEDEPLFSHCANGMIAVRREHFEKVVEPLLMIHGVDVVTISGLPDIDGDDN